MEDTLSNMLTDSTSVYATAKTVLDPHLMNFLNTMGWSTVAVIFVVIIAIIILITKFVRSRGEETTWLFGSLLSAVFLLLIISLVCIITAVVLPSADARISSDIVNVSFITLMISLAAIIPYLMANALTDKQIGNLVDKNVLPLKRKVQQTFDEELAHARVELWQSDSDDARMIGLLLLNSKNPDYLWSLSWLYRAIKSRVNHFSKNPNSQRHLSGLFVKQCMSFIRYDLCKIYQNADDRKKNNGSYFKEYEESFEKSYIGEGFAESELSYSTTLCRVLRDSVDFYYYLSDKSLGIGNAISDTEALEHALQWLISEIWNHLTKDSKGSEDDIIRKVAPSSYSTSDEDAKRFGDRLKKILELHDKHVKNNKNASEADKQKQIAQDFLDLLEAKNVNDNTLSGRLVYHYPAFESNQPTA